MKDVLKTAKEEFPEFFSESKPDEKVKVGGIDAAAKNAVTINYTNPTDRMAAAYATNEKN